jgi:Na+/H+ antiporter NhaA
MMMLLYFALQLAATLTAAQPVPSVSVPIAIDSATQRRSVTELAPALAYALVRQAPVGVVPLAPADTPRVTSFEYSDAYETRLTIHRWASYATLPLFAFQYVAGRQLCDESSDAPSWAKTGHRVAATGIAALFAVNTVTGVWNLLEARKDPAGRKWRTTHGVLMLVADAGFTATGLLAERAERSPENRRRHRNIAISSMAVATVSYLMMISPLRPD